MSKISNDHYRLLKELVGTEAGVTLSDLVQADDAENRFASFTPVGGMLVGLRYFNRGRAYGAMKPRADGKPPQMYQIRKGVIEPCGGKAFFSVTPPRVPHRVEGGLGYWHINDQPEMMINLPLEDGMCIVLLEGFPLDGRTDRFAWFCRECVNPLYMEELNTEHSGWPGFMTAEELAIQHFNDDVELRTCSVCGAVHPLAYSMYGGGDHPEREEARALW